jgi:hypothetical protein
MKTADNLVVLRLILGAFLILTARAAWDFYQQIQTLGVLFSPSSQMWWLLFLAILVILFELGLLLLTWTSLRQTLLSIGNWLVQHLPRSKTAVLVFLVAIVCGFAFFVLIPIESVVDVSALHGLLFTSAAMIVTLLLRRVLPEMHWLNILSVALLLLGSAYRLFQFLPDISLYPFSLGWSEASRFYYASLFFSGKVYGLSVPPSTLHPTRYLMQAVPFLVEGLPLWFHRVWQVILWLAGFLVTALVLARRLRISAKAWWWIFTAWVFLFLWQGPVYYHLLVMVILLLWGFDHQHWGRTLVVVVLASIWAGISRVNWFPVPGMLAALLYFLEKPKSDQPLWKYLFSPVIWVALGFGIAFGSQSLYILWSGNDPEQFASSFSSALLWYRLFPNSTYSLGVMTGVLLISLPIFWVVAFRWNKVASLFHPVAVLGIGAILGVLLLGGLVVSAKIGGGSNLHNLDAYLALLMVVGSYFYFERIPPIAEPTPIPAGLNLLLVLIPVWFALSASAQFVRYHPQTVVDSLSKMQRIFDRTLEDGGEILFISERQLLTFDYLEGIALVPEYEKVFLMEMVMAGNRNYLDAFQQDVASQRFDLIVTDPLFESYKENGESWAEENNVWVDAVSVPILCHYWRKITFPESGVQILAPRENPIDCKYALESGAQD